MAPPKPLGRPILIKGHVRNEEEEVQRVIEPPEILVKEARKMPPEDEDKGEEDDDEEVNEMGTRRAWDIKVLFSFFRRRRCWPSQRL